MKQTTTEKKKLEFYEKGTPYEFTNDFIFE